ncbi:rhomboid family intramembrane serine protease, partial [Thermococci archaeon]
MKKVWKYFPGTFTLLILITIVFAYEVV